MNTITTERVPILVWGDAVDGATLDQGCGLARPSSCSGGWNSIMRSYISAHVAALRT